MKYLILACALALSLAATSATQAKDQRDVEGMSRRINEKVDMCVGQPVKGYGHFTLVLSFYGDGTFRKDPEVLPGGSPRSKLNLYAKVLMAKLKACAPFPSIVSLGAGPREKFEMRLVY